jgi:hypothetical protein
MPKRTPFSISSPLTAGYIDGSIVVYVPSTQVVIDVAPIFRR